MLRETDACAKVCEKPVLNLFQYWGQGAVFYAAVCGKRRDGTHAKTRRRKGIALVARAFVALWLCVFVRARPCQRFA